MVSTHLNSSSSSATNEQQDVPSTSYMAGICLSVSLNPMLASASVWIIDSGASKHICFDVNSFLSLKPITNSRVTLPNNVSIPVSFCGNVRLSSQLILKDVLFIP